MRKFITYKDHDYYFEQETGYWIFVYFGGRNYGYIEEVVTDKKLVRELNKLSNSFCGKF